MGRRRIRAGREEATGAAAMKQHDRDIEDLIDAACTSDMATGCHSILRRVERRERERCIEVAVDVMMDQARASEEWTSGTDLRADAIRRGYVETLRARLRRKR